MSEFRRPVPLGESQIPVVTPEEARVTTFTSLRTPNYRWFWLGMLASFAGLQMQILARGWLVFDMTGSALALGIVSAAFGAPILLFSLYGGAVADRVNKRNLLIVTQAANALITLVIAILIFSGSIAIWHLMAAALCTGITFVFNGPGRLAIIPELVTRRELLNAIALNSTGMNLTRVIAFAIAGALVPLISVAGVYYIVVVCYIAAVAALFKISVPERVAAPASTSVGADLREGLSYIRHSPIILPLLAMAVIPIAFGLPYLNLMPVFADEVFNVGAPGLGILMAMAGAGALAGSLGIASLGDFRRKGMLLMILALGFGATLALFGISGSYALSLVVLLGVGAGGAGYMAVNNTLIQSNVPHQVRGRVMGIYMMTFALMPLGTLPLGALADAIGPSVAIGASGALIVLFTILMALLRPSLRRLQ
ncbi:MAG: MFS transporter [Dehalococcoidia bacterium]|nr:MAG: MFS transporter [Dehalococcoidia bacterium]